MKKITIISAVLLSCVTALSAQAYDVHSVDEVSVRILPEDFGNNGFWCNGRQFGSDLPLPKFHGCDAEEVTFGPKALPALLVRAHYGWDKMSDGSQRAKTQTFIELPNGEFFRLRDTRFITSPAINNYFRGKLNLGSPLNPENTGLHLSEMSKRNFQAYGQTFCISYQLQVPFTGVLGWCQGDTVLGGEPSHRMGILPYAEAVVAAQTYLYDMKLLVKSSQLIQPETLINFGDDVNGFYWAFVVPATKPGIEAYKIKVYMDARADYRALRKFPASPEGL